MTTQPLAAIEQFDFLKDVAWLEKSIFGNSYYAYLLTLASFLVIWGVLHMVRAFGAFKLEQAAEGSQNDALIFARDLIRQIRPYIFPAIALGLATKRLTLAPAVDRGISYLMLVFVTVQVVRIAVELASFLLLHAKTFTRDGDAMARNTARNIVVLVKFTIWSAAILFLLDNAGFNVSTFLAGLGIGGVAIALASQAVLGDAFSSFAIALDRPFEVGDSVTIDGLSGEVEYIGLKTTRVRSTGGELLVFANSDLTRSRIRNFKRMMQRNVTIKLSVEPELAVEKLKQLPKWLQDIVESTKNVTFDRAHFVAFGETALQFEIAYLVKDPGARVHLDAQQEINLKIREMCDREGVALAFAEKAKLR